MAGCCDPRGCDDFFGRRFARRMGRRYRRRGPDRPARRMLEFLEAEGIEGLTVLEVGGGIGEIGLELLKRGARSSLTLELSSAYDAEAERLVREARLEGRAARRVHDIAADPEAVQAADIVVLHRVVCCYPDYGRLLTAAAEHARRMLVFSYPPRNALSRLVVAADNRVLRRRGSEFRVFAHPPAAMFAVVEAHGFRRAFTDDGLVWHVAGLARSA